MSAGAVRFLALVARSILTVFGVVIASVLQFLKELSKIRWAIITDLELRKYVYPPWILLRDTASSQRSADVLAYLC